MDEISGPDKSSDDQIERIFPLPLTSIEKFHFYDGDDEHPNLIFGRLLFNQPIEEGLARTAWKTIAATEPLIHSCVSKKRGKLHWMIPEESEATSVADQNFSFVHSESHPSISKFPDPWFIPTPVDPAFNPGPFLMIRTFAGRPDSLETGDQLESNKSEVWFWAHHVVCDGAAAVGFIRNWLQVYRNLATNVDVENAVDNLNHASLRQRNNLQICSWGFLKNLPFQIVGLFGATKFLFRKTAVIAGRDASSKKIKESNIPAVVSDWLDEVAYSRLREEAGRLQLSLNALLLCDLFRAIHDWRVNRQPNVSEQDWLRIILPISLRGFKDRKLPIANRTSLVQIDRRELAVEFARRIGKVDRAGNYAHSSLETGQNVLDLCAADVAVRTQLAQGGEQPKISRSRGVYEFGTTAWKVRLHADSRGRAIEPLA